MTSQLTVVGLFPDERSFEYRSSNNKLDDMKLFFAAELKIPVQNLQVFHNGQEIWNQADFEVACKRDRVIKVHLRDRGRPTKVKGFSVCEVVTN